MSHPTPTVTPFVADLNPALDELRARLDLTRLPEAPEPDAVEGGLSLRVVRDLLQHWREEFDWGRAAERLTEHPQVRVRVGSEAVHAVHVPSSDDAATVVVLLHGWPDSPLRYRHMVRPLSDAGFTVVVPSLPGTGWSEAPAGPMTLEYAAEQIHGLLQTLGHATYAVHGGDWGAGVADALVQAHPEAVTALHLVDVPFSKAFSVDRSSATSAEVAYLDRFDAFAAVEGEGLYFTIQSTIPTTFSLGLHDSPLTLAAWHLDKFRRWSETEIDVDEVLLNVILHWVTQCSRSAMRFYAESFTWDDEADWSAEGDAEAGGWESSGDGDDWASTPDVPMALAAFPRDLAGPPPREYVERFYRVRRFTAMPRGGHFGALEEPELLTDDLVTFLAEVR